MLPSLKAFLGDLKEAGCQFRSLAHNAGEQARALGSSAAAAISDIGKVSQESSKSSDRPAPGVPGHGTSPVAGLEESGNGRRASRLEREMAAWKEDPSWHDDAPRLKVSVPKGALCDLECTFSVGLPPDAVMEILCDPGNKRVFKNIKEVKFRRVLESDGQKQRVEVEQVAMWRFLWLTGTFDVRLEVEEDRNERKMTYKIVREGFMKKFEGSWAVAPLAADGGRALEPVKSAPPCACASEFQERIASEVTVQQLVQPALMPPGPIAWYVRGITSAAMSDLLRDLQSEARRIRELNSGGHVGAPEGTPPSQARELRRQRGSQLHRRRSARSRWHDRSRA